MSSEGYDPYNIAVLRADEMRKGVRFTHQYEIVRNVGDLPPKLVAWAREHLPDGEYVTQYRIDRDAWMFGRVEFVGGVRKVESIDQEWSA